MDRRTFLALASALPLRLEPPGIRRTAVSIDADGFRINGKPTCAGRTFRGMPIEGLLMNARLVQGIFDDRNPQTRSRWAYPDTGVWDPERNTREFVEAMPAWRDHGLLAFTINLQGGSPQGYSKEQPWHNSAIEADGSLRPDYLARLARILDRADELGMVAIVGYFYFGQDERLGSEGAVLRATREATAWLLDRGYTNVLVEVANECDNRAYQQTLISPPRIPVLIELVKSIVRDGRRLPVGTSFNGGVIPTPDVVASSDFVLLHGNGVAEPARIAAMVEATRALPTWRPKPILFNEDDHFDFDRPSNNLIAAVSRGASWGYFDPGASDYEQGYQCPPVRWTINTPRKQAFFGLLKEMTGA
jgi:hypothetical protein